MDLSVDPLPAKQGDFLKSGGGLFSKNINKSQYRIDIVKHLDLAIRYFYHILPKSHLLDKEKIYDKINAQTLEDFLKNSLMDIENQDDFRLYSYDFRTAELARLFFETSSDYLKQNSYLKDKDKLFRNVLEALETISEFYEMLANDGLQKDPYGTLKKKEEENLKRDLRKVEQEIQEAIKPGSKYEQINKKHSELSDHQIKLDNEYHKLQSEKAEKQSQLNTFTKDKDKNKIYELKNALKEIEIKQKNNRIKRKPINEEILKLQTKRKKIIQPLNEEKTKIQNELNRKYEHLDPYFCSLSGHRLSSFAFSDIPHKPKEEQKHGL